jgi:pilus assembly protein CpaC
MHTLCAGSPGRRLRAIALVGILLTLRRTHAQEAAGPFERLSLTAGRSIVLSTTFDVTRIAVTNPATADATVVAPREVLIDGKATGTVSLIVWGADRRVQYDVVVQPAITSLQQELQTLFPGETIRVSASDDAVILSGKVSSNAVSLRAGEIAAAAAPKARLINMLQLPSAGESEQVLLQVRFAEVNRRALVEAGASLFANRNNFLGRTATQQFSAPTFEQQNGQNRILFSDFLNLFFLSDQGIGAVVRALQSRGYFHSLAEPNLLAYNGQEASFLAGGEFPVPVVQGGAAVNNVTILFKEFGVRLTFKPTIAGDVIRLKVRPEVSSLDFNNGITLSGFRVPALTTRRAETDIELRDGQSFAIAGLMDNTAQADRAAVPILRSLPIVGALFKSKAERREQTELLVLITPHLVKPLNADQLPPLPTDPNLFLQPGREGDAYVGAPQAKTPKRP